MLLILKQKQYLTQILSFPLNAPFLIYIISFSMTKLINSGLEESINTMLRCSQDYFIVIWVMLYVLKHAGKNNLIKEAIYLSAYLSMAYGVLQIFHLDFFHRQESLNRLSGFHKNPYSYGGQLIVFFFLFFNDLFIFKEDSFVKRSLRFLIVLISFICILNTTERAVILGVLLGIGVYLFLRNKIFSDRDSLKLGALILVPILLVLCLNKKVLTRIKRTLFPPKGIESLIRLKLWGLALSLWKENLLFGLGKFPSIRYQPGDALSVQYLTHAHNVYLQILVANGLIGFIAFVNLFFSILKFLFENLRKNPYVIALIVVIISLLIEGFFEYFWGDSEVRYLMLYFAAFVFGLLMELKLKRV